MFIAISTRLCDAQFSKTDLFGGLYKEDLDGILKAKARGVHFGRERKLSDEQVRKLKRRRESGELVKHLMADYDISKATLYRYLSED